MRLKLDGHAPQIDWDDPALQLTDAQKHAMATDREIAVLAGAGTGKTHTLALRYVALLLALAARGEEDVQQVLVLTFTEKAAQEMSERCHRRLVALAAAARASDHPLARQIADPLERMVDGFDRARIGTFHGFCARLLHELPSLASEAGPHVPLGARPLDPIDAGPLLEEVLADALDAELAETPEAVWPLLDTFGTRHALIEAGQIALERWSILERLVGRYADGLVRIEDRLAGASPTPREAAEWLTSVGLPALHLLIRLVAPSGGGPFVERTLRPAWEALQRDTDPDPLAVYGRYREVLDLLLTETGTLRKLDHHGVIGRKDAWPDERRYRLAKDAAIALTARVDDWEVRARRARALPTRADRALLDGLQPFGRFVRRAAALLHRRLDEDRSLTFEEIQRRAVRAVLDHPTVRSKLRERFRYLMVDELQDTDEAQWQLILALGRADPAEPEDRIFVVGDPQQAIYGFRGGDVTVFDEAIRTLSGHTVALDRNFRSRTGLIDWFNGVFPSVLLKDHRPLVAGRPDPGGRVWWIDTEDSPEATARWVAGAIGPDAPWSDRTLHPTPPLAILLRARTRQAAFEGALRRWKVPYVVVGGVGFWARQEVLDIVNLVAAVAHRDPISRLGVLRGPFGGVPDDELTTYDADRVLAPWMALRDRVPAAAFVRRAVEHMLPALAVLGEIERASANLDRLCMIVDGFGAIGLAALADRLVQRVEGAVRESEATLVASEARVVLCTVHAAKGLEFPIVVVPELERRVRGQRPPLLVARTDAGVLEIAARVLDPDADVETRIEPGQYRTLADALTRAEDAEERRLLYVALTRARDELVLVGAAQDAPEPGARASWMQLVAATLPSVTLRLSEVPAPMIADPPPEDPRSSALPARPAPIEDLIVSASTLHHFVACPARWKRAEQMGIPEGPRFPLAGARGRILHQVLQDGITDEAAIRARYAVEATRTGASDAERDTGLAELLAHLAITRAHPGVQRALTARGAAEVPFRVRHGPVVLQGRIDRLWQDRDGSVVLDWKSESLNGRTPAALAAEHRPQWLSYAWAAATAGPVVRVELVMTEIGHLEALPVDRAADEVPALLDAVHEIASRRWEEVEEEVVGNSIARPCGSCGYRGRGCRGR